MMKPMALLSSIWLAACSVFGITGVKEPPYRLVAKVGSVEIRQYAPRIVAETTVRAGELEARSVGFRRVAGYIFGANHAQAKIAMTAPVAQQTAGGGQTIAMTAPVAQASAAGGAWTIAFFMPADYTMQTLPAPNDPAVTLRELPAQDFAVLRFSGLTAPDTVARETARLLRGLAGSAWTPVGEPVAWFYDPPWTLPPLRRNEVAVAVQGR
jgi:hypothetical protein